jgi:hypothetical protein
VVEEEAVEVAVEAAAAVEVAREGKEERKEAVGVTLCRCNSRSAYLR